MSRTVNFSPDKSRICYNKNPDPGGAKVGGNKKLILLGIVSFEIPRSSDFSAVRLLKRIGAEVASVLRLTSNRERPMTRVSSVSLVRSRSYAETLDSPRAQAIEDCIQFLNSSSSLQRTCSVSSSC